MKGKKGLVAICAVIVAGIGAILALWLTRGNGEQGSMLITASGTEYVLRDDRGREMTFEVDQVAGTLPVLDWDPIGAGETSFEVEYSDSLSYIGEQDRVELSVEAETWAQSVDGTGLDQVTFAGGSGIVLEGENFTFHAALNYPLQPIPHLRVGGGAGAHRDGPVRHPSGGAHRRDPRAGDLHPGGGQRQPVYRAELRVLLRPDPDRPLPGGDQRPGGGDHPDGNGAHDPGGERIAAERQ